VSADELDRHGFFVFRKKIRAPSVLEVYGFHPGKRFNQVTEVLANGPDLPPMHRVDAFQESFERLVAKDHSVTPQRTRQPPARARAQPATSPHAFSLSIFSTGSMGWPQASQV
jgi:hypothetical protein